MLAVYIGLAEMLCATAFFSVRKGRLHPIDALPCFSPARHIWSKRRGMSRFSLVGLALWLAFI
jgi:hypothetical protein